MSKDRKFALTKQISKFAIVGLTSTAVHAVLFTGLVELGWSSPLASNLIGYLVGFCVSFTGHYLWTFSEQRNGENARSVFAAQTRFFVVAAFGLGLNSLAVYFVTDVWQISYRYSLIFIVFLTPLSTFALSKFWAFRAE